MSVSFTNEQIVYDDTFSAEQRFLCGTAGLLAAIAAMTGFRYGLDWVAFVGAMIALPCLPLAVLMPDRRVTVDCSRRIVITGHRFSWQSSFSENVTAFTDVKSFGVAKTDNDGTHDYCVMIRRRSRKRPIVLWSIGSTPKSEPDARILEAMRGPDLIRLQQMTGFRREDNIQ